MTTQLATRITPVAPLKSEPVTVCPVRHLCKPPIQCGFEMAGTVDGCPKRSRYANPDA